MSRRAREHPLGQLRKARTDSRKSSIEAPQEEHLPTPARVKLRAAAVAAGLGLMVIVPLTRLDDPRPSPLGWHMYAANVVLPSIQVTLSSGATEDRNFNIIAAHLRGEPDYIKPTAEFICAREKGVTSVRFTRNFPVLDQEYLCGDF